MDNIENKQVTRRRFMRNSAMAAAGLGSVLAGCKARKVEEKEPNAVEPEVSKIPKKEEYPQVPRRKLGKTGVDVPVLALGTMFNLIDNQIVLRSTLKYGVKYWDTAHSYAGGNSELGIGKYLEKNPEARKNLFLVTKASRAKNREQWEERLQTSLERMNTDHIDLYYAPHAASDPAQLTDELKQWAEDAKKRELIRFFGFTTHQNMAKCLAAAAKLGWIDVIMPAYNFRIMQDPEMPAAIEACHKANIGLIAMKTTGKTTLKRFKQAIETETDKKLVEHFLQRGFTPEQACIKLVLEDERISCAAVQMENISVLTQNVAAVLDKTKFTEADKEIFRQYARATCDGYCAGCSDICDSALRKSARGRLTAESIGLPDVPCVSDIMRYLMYYNSYGEQDKARGLFAKIPRKVRNKLLTTDYTLAEARCPQHLPIAKLVAEAVSKLA